MRVVVNKRAIIEEGLMDRASSFIHRRVLGQTPANGYHKDANGNYIYDRKNDEELQAQYHRPTHVNDGDGNMISNHLEDKQ